jgi:serine/threonine protein kinase
MYLHSRKPQPELEAHDSEPYAVLKFCTCDYVNNDAAQREVKVHEHLVSADVSHRGLPYIQTMTESFELTGPSGTHTCLVFEPMRETLSLFQFRLKSKRFTLELMKMYLVCLLNGLDYLHSECRIIHTGELKSAFLLKGLEN